MHSGLRPSCVVRAGLVGIVCLSVYRAATQSITWDEAFTYLWLLRGPFSQVLLFYNANNHVLFSALAWVCTHLFGPSELVLRLPTLLGAVVFTVSIYRVCLWLVGDRWWLVPCVGATALHPLVMDFMVAARGYGLALASLVLAIERSIALLDGDPWRRGSWTAVSAALALCACSNLAYSVPAAALGATLTAIVVLPRGDRRQLLPRVMVWLVAPAAALVTLILAVPLSGARQEHFWYGAQTLVSSLRSLTDATIPAGWRGGTLSVVVLLAAIGAGAVVVVAALSRVVAGRDRQDSRARAFAVLAGSLGVTIGMLVALHIGLGIPYPMDRTGLYLMVLGSLSLVALVGRPGPDKPRLTGVAAACVAMSALLFASQLRVSYFEVWRFDAGSRDIFAVIAGTRAPAGRPLRVATTRWLFAPSLEFYRVVWRTDDVEPINDDWDPVRLDYDFFVLDPSDTAALEVRRATQRVFTHPISGATLFTRLAP